MKDEERLIAAYDDPAGVTAEFNRNVLAVIDRELGADFDPDAFEHVARWDAVGERIELLLRSLRPQRVAVRDLGLEVEFAEGEELRTEWSAKFRRDTVTAELDRGGAGARPLVDGPGGRLRPGARRPQRGRRRLMIDSPRKPCDNGGCRNEPSDEES